MMLAVALLASACTKEEIPLRPPRFLSLSSEAQTEAAANECTFLHHVRAEADVHDSAAARATSPIFVATPGPAEEDAIADLKARAAAYGANYVRLDRMTWIGSRAGWIVVHGTAYRCVTSAAPIRSPRVECTTERPGLRTCVPVH